MTLEYITVTPLLKEVLGKLMQTPSLAAFRLVGGTALSLRLGHRESVDIDLFTQQEYDTIDWRSIYRFFQETFPYADIRNQADGLHSFGETFYLGNSETDRVKVDLFYTEPFLQPTEEIDGIRFASLDDIVAMKVDIVSRGGRMKDFWDLHELLDSYSIEQMLDLHQQRYPWVHDRADLLRQFTNFEQADGDFTPVCLRGKHWELIKADFVDLLQKYLEKEL